MEDRIASLPRAELQFTNDATADELQIAVENSMTGISWLDTDGVFRVVREGYAQMLGYEPEELIGKSWEVTVVEADRPGGRAAFPTMLRDGQVNVESRAVRKDGSIFYKKLLLVKTTDAQGQHSGHYCFMSDVTEQVETKRRLDEAERLRTVGMLAGGIAHDLNNLLSPILGFSDLLTREPEKVVGAVETIREASERAQKLTQRLLEFSKAESSHVDNLCLNKIVDVATKWVTGSLPAGVRVEVESDADCTLVRGEEARLEALIMNLMANSGYAMRETGGTISIRVRNPDPGTVELTVADDGPGIPVEDQPRIFEPFFTTKPVDKGCGLGLYMVKDTVDSMGGSIHLVSSPGAGTCFAMTFECTQEPSAAVTSDTPDDSPAASLRVLVVDDQLSMLSVCEAMLNYLGHTCELVTNPDEALAKVGPDFDLVLSDYRIGGSSGLTLVDELKETGLPVILMSGHLDGIESLPDAVVARLHKPFDIEALEAALQEVSTN